VPRIEDDPSVADVLQRYAAYRRKQVQDSIDAITYGPFQTGNVNRAEALRQLNIVLTEIENLSAWLADGQPSVKTVMSKDQEEHYRWAVSQGFDVPDEIKSQLGL
jgi:hypothetical protein